MWTLLTGSILSSIFENQTVKLFEDLFSNEKLILIGIIVGWFFQEFTTEEYGIPGGKKFMIDYDYRYRTITQMVLITKKFLFYIHLVSFLEFGTFLILIGLYFVILRRFALFNVKIIKIKIKKAISFMTNILKDIDLPGFKISRLWSFWTWSFNDTVLFYFMFFLIRHGFFKVYSWKDFLFILRPVLYLIFFLFVFYSVFLLCYLVYLCFMNRLIINIALILKVITKKILAYFCYLYVLIDLAVSDIEIENLSNENFFKESFFKVLLFLI
jgi:hypothetical protein